MGIPLLQIRDIVTLYCSNKDFPHKIHRDKVESLYFVNKRIWKSSQYERAKIEGNIAGRVDTLATARGARVNGVEASATAGCAILFFFCPDYSQDYLELKKEENLGQQLEDTNMISEFKFHWKRYLMKLFLNGGAMLTWKIFPYKEGCVEKMVTESTLLKYANEVYAIRAYRLFEEQFMKFSEYYQGLVRWTKDIDLSLDSSGVGDVRKVSNKDIAGYSAWRREMLRKFSDLIFASELNINAQEYIEKGFRMTKDKISSKVGPYYEVSSSNINDLVGRRTKGERNIRKKNIIEIKCNQARGKERVL
ncbi:hypothetical protein M9H77_11728 [Catharanthus roseus]|uniref:Uncharacterized protein n=1 Tax=Catharanthus roseus TaxID=4058 RepID=A0ACC0BFH9_CATRO|nr:hypothetical protein M9H77_11728 [Catharanthus roseus]